MINKIDNHPSSLANGSLAAQVLNFMNRGGLGLLELAAAADVVAAACRNNFRMQCRRPSGGEVLNKKVFDDDEMLRMLEDYEANYERCQAAMAAFVAGGSREALCSEFVEIVEFLNSFPR